MILVEIDVKVRRLGGGYGLKISRNAQIAVAAALVTYKLNRPCRFINPLVNNMKAIGKRMPCSRDFEVGVNDNGVIQYANVDLYGDHGYIVNETMLLLGIDAYYNCYRKESWKCTIYNTITDTPSNTWCRSPGSLENIAMVEILLERIAYELNLDSLEVRLANLDTKHHSDLIKMSDTLKSNSQYAQRKTAVDTFNKNNRWKKRGLRFALLRWAPIAFMNYEVNLSVYAGDGTIVITHGGMEMGQGVNMKAIQICAYILKVPVEKIQIKPNDTTIAPNCSVSGSSLTTPFTGIGVKKCCEELLIRLAPIKLLMRNPTWVELIQKAHELQVDLHVSYYTTIKDIQIYNIYGVALAETEIDVLTGEYQLRQVDILQDVGRSVNPELDVGQVEGGFTMALGYWTSENLVYDTNSGELLTNRTWEYWVPQSLDIPQVLNVYLQKKSYSTDLVMGAKVVGEPPTCLGVVVPLALRAAIVEARRDSGLPSTEWFPIDGPYTVDKICTSTATKVDQFKFY
ncbi:uncharacterized protein LOC112054760 [Bicyclus anynana]|uniref:Uncharacterized protein LOC112054760 n=1 Tax=Bicyclus anynana TaxID=110368 RepID=A0ABM3LT99_BICAN|nr:uncharacterized protein LOC112054760 [Bicyclus anynana]